MLVSNNSNTHLEYKIFHRWTLWHYYNTQNGKIWHVVGILNTAFCDWESYFCASALTFNIYSITVSIWNEHVNTKIGPGDMYEALSVNKNMEKMFLPWLEEGSGGCEVRRALTPIHLSFYLCFAPSLFPSLSPSPTRDTLKMIHPHTYACADVEIETWTATVI